MLGNVWEWTCSKYEEKYAGAEEVCTDIKSAGDVFISIRGGAGTQMRPESVPPIVIGD